MTGSYALIAAELAKCDLLCHAHHLQADAVNRLQDADPEVVAWLAARSHK